MKRTLQTTLTSYRLNLDNPEDSRAYAEIKAKLSADNRRKMHALHMPPAKGAREYKHGIEEEDVTIELEYIFDNQWNTTKERVFDWYEGIVPNKSIRLGHYLRITDEMHKVRAETHTCGYCGKHYGPLHAPLPADGFCAACLDSPYLEETELHLLRLLPLAGHQERAQLTEEEKAQLLPRYVERQTTGADSRAKAQRDKERADVIAKYENKTKDAQVERDGMLWLWDKGFPLSNVIYYSHSGYFGFGWRQPVGASVLSKLLDVISEFPFPYEIKTEDGRTLSHK